MKLTQYSDLGLRLLMYLALRNGESVTIQEVSKDFSSVDQSGFGREHPRP
jgi:DNA-binding IscR family transcriptional regulator